MECDSCGIFGDSYSMEHENDVQLDGMKSNGEIDATSRLLVLLLWI